MFEVVFFATFLTATAFAAWRRRGLPPVEFMLGGGLVALAAGLTAGELAAGAMRIASDTICPMAVLVLAAAVLFAVGRDR